MKINTNLFVLVILFSVLMSSCMTTKTSVGKYMEMEGVNHKYSKGKQIWLFWGILPLGRTNVNTPGDGNCMVITRYNLVDLIIGGVTGGIITTQTIKVKIKKKISVNP